MFTSQVVELRDSQRFSLLCSSQSSVEDMQGSCRCNRPNIPHPQKLLWRIIRPSQSIPSVHLACHMTLSNILAWQLQKLSQYQNTNNSCVFLLDLEKTIKVNTFKVYTIRQHISSLWYDMWKTAVYFWVVPVHISGTTLTLIVSLQHLWIIWQIKGIFDLQNFHPYLFGLV